jgi:hypothetical protein
MLYSTLGGIVHGMTISSADTEADFPAPGRFSSTAVAHYLGRVEVAARIGLKSVRSLSGMTLPPHDVEVGVHKGWKPDTIDAWQATRPGRGRWGQR